MVCVMMDGWMCVCRDNHINELALLRGVLGVAEREEVPAVTDRLDRHDGAVAERAASLSSGFNQMQCGKAAMCGSKVFFMPFR